MVQLADGEVITLDCEPSDTGVKVRQRAAEKMNRSADEFEQMPSVNTRGQALDDRNIITSGVFEWGARVIRMPEGDIAVFRTGDDRVFALHDQCPHRQGPLSQGIVHGGRVTCPLHNWKIELETGEAAGPDEGSTACFPVRIEDGRVLLQPPPSEAKTKTKQCA